jgi:hypothetical protein
MSAANLEQAIERADLRDLIADLYPDACVHPNLSKQRISAPWRGGDNPEVVSLSARTAHDFKTGETWNPWTFLTEAAGFSKRDAASELLRRAGMVDTPRAKRQAARRERTSKLQDQRRETWKRRELEVAHERQRTGSTTDPCSYFERKQVSAFFDTHEVAAATGPDGGELPGLTFGSTKWGTYAQLALRTLDGAVTGYQRIYDAKVLPGERDKDFIGPTKGAFVLLVPKGVTLPKSNITALLERGHELGICEGVATGMSVCMARPRTIMLCALSAGNLSPVLETFRERYRYRRDHKGGKKAVSVTIWADNDQWGELNAGLTKAHEAGALWSCSVRVPNFKGRTPSGAKPTDFNDLHALAGLDAVNRTRPQEPQGVHVFAKALCKQKLSTDKYLAPFELPDHGAALIIRSPMETGKTHQLEATLARARAANLRVLVVVHRESLADSLAARLGLENYNDYAAQDLRHVNRGLVICFDSLHKLTIGGELPGYDVLVLDECEQVLRHAASPHIRNKAANFDALTHYLARAPRFIGLDAHAGALTVWALRHFAPAKAVRWHRHDHHIAAERKARLVFDQDDVLDQLETSTARTWLSTDSLKLTRNLDAYLDDPGTLTINSETTPTDPVQAFFRDPTRTAPTYRRVIVSPSVQTGVSEDSGTTADVLGLFSGNIGTPQDAEQSLLRARGAPRLSVYVNPARRKSKTAGEFIAEAETANAAEAERLGRESYATPHAGYTALAGQVREHESKARSNFKHALARELTMLGFNLSYALPRDLSPKEVERRKERREQLREAGMQRYVEDRVRAERIDATKALELKDKHRLTQDEMFAFQQWEVRDFYGLPDDTPDTVLAEMLERDNYGKLRTQIRNYENFIEPEAVARSRAESHLEHTPLEGDQASTMLVREFYQRLGEVVGLNAETESAVLDEWEREGATIRAEAAALRAEREGATTQRKGQLDIRLKRLGHKLDRHDAALLPTTYSAQDPKVKAFMSWLRENYQALSHALKKMPELEQLEGGYIVARIGKWLRHAGLKQQATGGRGADYAVTLQSVSIMRGFSRPRRISWPMSDFSPYKSTYIQKVLPTLEITSQTTKAPDAQNAKPDHDPKCWALKVSELLEAGKLEPFGAQKLATIRQRIQENNTAWLYQLATSRDMGRVLGHTA